MNEASQELKREVWNSMSDSQKEIAQDAVSRMGGKLIEVKPTREAGRTGSGVIIEVEI